MLREADDIEQSEKYDVEEVMSSRKIGRRILYLVKWLDYPDGKTGWKNHTTTSRKEAWKSFGNFIGGIPTHRKTIGSPKNSPTTNKQVRRNQKH